jgi:hypothetical protein
MAQNEQAPSFFTISSGQTLTLNLCRSISILAVGGAASIQNAGGQTMSIPTNATVEINADTGNTLSTIVVTATSSALVVMLGGSGIIT